MEIWLIVLTIILVIAVTSLILAHILLHFTKAKEINKGENNDKN